MKHKHLTKTFLLLSSISAISLTCFAFGTNYIQAQNYEPAAEGKSKASDANIENNFQIMNVQGLSGRIAFSAVINNTERLLVLDLDTKKIRRLVEDASNNSFPAWSPDGKQVAFVSDRDGNKEIYLANWDGTNQKRLTVNAVVDDAPAWAPDGKSIIFYQDDSTKTSAASSNIIRYFLSSSTFTQLTKFKGRNTVPKFSPDGSSIAYSTNRFWPGWDLCIWSLQTHTESCVLNGKDSYCRGFWSPSGSHLAYSTGSFDDIDIAVLDLASGSKSALTDMQNKEYDVSWSPSGSLVIFVSEADTKGIFNIYTVDLQKKVTPLLKSSYTLRYPSWTATKTLELEAARIREEELLELLSKTTPLAQATTQTSPEVKTLTPTPIPELPSAE